MFVEQPKASPGSAKYKIYLTSIVKEQPRCKIGFFRIFHCLLQNFIQYMPIYSHVKLRWKFNWKGKPLKIIFKLISFVALTVYACKCFKGFRGRECFSQFTCKLFVDHSEKWTACNSLSRKCVVFAVFW